MSLMVSPVSRLSFGDGVYTVTPQNKEEFLSRSGAYTMQQDAQVIAQEDKPKKHSALKAVLGTIAGIAVVAFGLYAAHKWGGKTFDASKEFTEFKDVQGFDKIKGYVTTAIAKAGKWVGETCQKVVDFVKKPFSHSDSTKPANPDAPTNPKTPAAPTAPAAPAAKPETPTKE